jgi:hypothetical protein
MPSSPSLPFTPQDAPLKQRLRAQHLRKVASWLVAPPNSTQPLARQAGSLWEAALTIGVLYDIATIFRDTPSADPADATAETALCAAIDSKCLETARWLLGEARVAGIGGSKVWEKGLFDNAVILRAVLVAFGRHGRGFGGDETKAFADIIVGGLLHICSESLQLEADGKFYYGSGAGDMAQVLTTVVCALRDYPEIVTAFNAQHKIKGPNHEEHDLQWITGWIAQSLVRQQSRHSRKVINHDDPDPVSDAVGTTDWSLWDSPYATADVTEALASFLSLDAGRPEYEDAHEPDLRKEVSTTLRAGWSYLELSQTESQWGCVAESAVVLRGYLSVVRIDSDAWAARGNTRPSHTDLPYEPDNVTTFKTLRWLCDEKQVSEDGSFLHSLLLTLYYAQALVETYRAWPKAEEPIETVYDDFVWRSRIPTTLEKARRLKLEVANDHLTIEVDRLNQEVAEREERRYRETRTLTKWITTLIILILAMPMTFAMGSLLDFYNIAWTQGKIGDFFQYLSVPTGVVAAIIAVVWGYDHFRSQDR